MSGETRYGIIKVVHIGVKLLYDHNGTTNRDLTKKFPTPTINDNGKFNIREI